MTKIPPDSDGVDPGDCEVWDFRKIDYKTQRKGKYTAESVQHPAKMQTYLCQKILLRFSKAGETVLDPMVGVGTTLVEAILLGRNAIGIEYEERFFEMSKENIALNEGKIGSSMIAFLAGTGKAVVLCGDSRKLVELLEKYKDDIAHVVTSPPFYSTVQERKIGESLKKGHKVGIASDPEKHGHKGVIGPYAEKEDNIDNLYDYGNSKDLKQNTVPSCEDKEGNRSESNSSKNVNRAPVALSDGPGAISHICCSPPYSITMSKDHGGGSQRAIARGKPLPIVEEKGLPGVYSAKDDNIGNLDHGNFSLSLLSPPYSSGRVGNTDSLENLIRSWVRFGYSEEQIESLIRRHGITENWEKSSQLVWKDYSEDKDNIGNLSHGRFDL